MKGEIGLFLAIGILLVLPFMCLAFAAWLLTVLGLPFLKTFLVLVGLFFAWKVIK